MLHSVQSRFNYSQKIINFGFYTNSKPIVVVEVVCLLFVPVYAIVALNVLQSDADIIIVGKVKQYDNHPAKLKRIVNPTTTTTQNSQGDVSFLSLHSIPHPLKRVDRLWVPTSLDLPQSDIKL